MIQSYIPPYSFLSSLKCLSSLYWIYLIYFSSLPIYLSIYLFHFFSPLTCIHSLSSFPLKCLSSLSLLSITCFSLCIYILIYLISSYHSHVLLFVSLSFSLSLNVFPLFLHSLWQISSLFHLSIYPAIYLIPSHYHVPISLSLTFSPSHQFYFQHSSSLLPSLTFPHFTHCSIYSAMI